MKPQAKPTGPQPPQFQHDGIDPFRALLLLGLLLVAAVVLVLMLVGSPLLWWIGAGVTAAGAAGMVALRRSGRLQAAVRKLPGVTRAGAALRRMPSGRFARSPLGRVVNRALGGPSAGSRAGGHRAGSPGSRPRGLRAPARAALPSWAGGTRGQQPRAAGKAPSRRARARAAFARMMPGPRGRAARAAAAAAQAGSRSRAATTAGRKPGRRAAGQAGRRARAAGAAGAGSKPKGKGQKKPPGGGAGQDTTVDVGAALGTAAKVGRLLGRYARKLRKRRRSSSPETTDTPEYDNASMGDIRLKRPSKPPVDTAPQPAEPRDTSDPSVGIYLGELVNTARKNTAAKATSLAKKRAQREKAERANAGTQASAGPEPPPEQQREKQDRDPPGSPSAASSTYKPSSHHEAPRITSTNTGGKPMAVSPTMHNDLVTNANTRRQGWQDAADAFRHDANELDEKAREHTRAATAFKSTGNFAAAEEREAQARQLRDDANTCRSYASKYQEKANEEQSPAA